MVASNAIGRVRYGDALIAEESGIKPVTLFDTACFKAKAAGEVKDFDPASFLGPKGLRTLDRSTKLLAVAAKLALEDAGIIITDENSAGMGMVTGTTMGSIRSISEFDRESLVEGPQYVNPALFPNTVINSPSSQVSIRFRIRGLNTTISTGFTASADAVGYALDALGNGKARTVLAAGVEELCPEIFWALEKTRFSAVFGEGACVLVLEDPRDAAAAGRVPLAYIRGYGAGFEPYRTDKIKAGAPGLRRAMRAALAAAGCGSEDIDCIVSAANSIREADQAEAGAIREVFGESARQVPVTAYKSLIGECMSAWGALGIAAAVEMLRRGQRRNILVNALGPTGCSSSVIVSAKGI